jgi:Putative zinc-finger
VTDHPDREQLAAFQAGDGDRRQRADVEAHLAGCPSCAEVVASVERARGRLAVLEEPDLPPGLHDRLSAAVQREAAEAAAERPEPGRPVSLDGRRATRAARGAALGADRRTDREAHLGADPGADLAPDPGADLGADPGADPDARRTAHKRRRPTPWYRRPVAWGAAAALVLAALVVPFLDQGSDNLTTAGGGGAGADTAAQEAAAPGAVAPGQLPVVRIAGEVSAATVRARLADDAQAKAALDSAAARDRQATPDAAPSKDQPGAAPSQDQPGAAGNRSSVPTPPPAAGGDAGPCLTAATAAAGSATRPLTPAFLIEGTYRGRAATVLVTTSAGRPGRVDLWVFPRGDCSSRPLATERVS